MAQLLTSTTTRSLVRRGPQLLLRSSSKHMSTASVWAAPQQKLRQQQQQQSISTATTTTPPTTPRLSNDADDVENLLLYRTQRRGALVRGYSTATTTATTATTTTTVKTTPELRNWSFEEVKQQISSPQQGRIIIDLREPSELRETGIIPSAHSLPFNTNPEGIFLPAPEFYDRFGFHKPGRSPSTGDDHGGEIKEVIFYCRAGVRSKAAARLAGGEGGWDGVKVGDMRGGWIEWEKRGGPVERVVQGRRK